MRLNKTAKLAFYTARKRNGDTNKLAENTGLTSRYINYVLRGERSVNQNLADKMYNMSSRRMKTSELA